jgi:hypothetical protein
MRNMHKKQLHNPYSSSVLNEVKEGSTRGTWRRSRKGIQNFRYKFPHEETIYRTEGEFLKKQKKLYEALYKYK